MKLFEEDSSINLLPFDGIVNYYGKVMDQKDADRYFEILSREIEWKNDEAMMFGKHIITKRKVAWYADHPFSYTYSNTTKYALPWTAALLQLKQLAEKLTADIFNSCLLNLYHDGSEGMAWHSDDEKELAPHASVASFSLGAERKFSFRHKKTKETVSLILENGSLLNMKGATQINWLHRLPPTAKIKGARINLTFRRMVQKF
ncbi:MAG: alpha-ketoglutarate-dependent dioxygenase AlkB [Ferruginibacter sp.]